MAQMRASKDQLPPERVGNYQWRMTQLGNYYVRFESIPAGFDDAEFLKGLPDDACQCEHWGYLFKGTMKFRHSNGHEQVVSGRVRPTTPAPVIRSRLWRTARA